MNVKKIGIYANGKLSEELLQKAQSYDYLIATDIAALKLIKTGKVPNLAVGDFDSVSAADLEIIKKKVPKINISPGEKDFTDLHLAVLTAISLKPESIDIYGATGTRIDHLLAGIFLLDLIHQKKIRAKIIDTNNEIELPDKYLYPGQSSKFKYLSLLPLSQTARVSISGAKYCLINKNISRGETIGVSNEIIDDNARITVHTGMVVIIKSVD